MLGSLPQDGLCTPALQVKWGLGVTITNSQALHVMGSLHHRHLVVKTKSQIKKSPVTNKKHPGVASSPQSGPQKPKQT